MKSLLVFFLICMALFFSAGAQRFSVFTGFSYIQQYPDGPNIRNYPLPNLEGKASFAFLNATHFKMSTGLGFATHNFGLQEVGDNKNYGYLRVEPFVSFTATGCLSDESRFPVQGVFAGFRAGLFNQWNFNPSWQVGLISRKFGKTRFYIQFSKLLYYKIPDNNYLLFDYSDNYYPLGNECWSITAGVVWNFAGKGGE